MFCLSLLVLVQQTENPRLTGNRGFLENLLLLLPVASHDANLKAIALPNGHATIGRRMLQSCNHRGFHFQRRKKHHFGTFVKEFLTRQMPILHACRTARWW